MFKTLNQTLMKKAIIAAFAVIILAAGAATCWTVFGGNEDDFFNENLEALMDQEIIVGDLCVVWPHSASTTLGEVLKEHYKA